MYTQSMHLLNLSTCVFLGKHKQWNSVVTGLFFNIYMQLCSVSFILEVVFFHFFLLKLKDAATVEHLCKSEIKFFSTAILWVPMMNFVLFLRLADLKRKNMADNLKQWQ